VVPRDIAAAPPSFLRLWGLAPAYCSKCSRCSRVRRDLHSFIHCSFLTNWVCELLEIYIILVRLGVTLLPGILFSGEEEGCLMVASIKSFRKRNLVG
jgi:hypothetical protein